MVAELTQRIGFCKVLVASGFCLLFACKPGAPALIEVGSLRLSNPQVRANNPGRILLRPHTSAGVVRYSHAPSREQPVMCGVEVRSPSSQKAFAALSQSAEKLPSQSRSRRQWLHTMGRFEGIVSRVPVGKDYIGVGIRSGSFDVELYALQKDNALVLLEIGTFSVDPERKQRSEDCRFLLNSLRE